MYQHKPTKCICILVLVVISWELIWWSMHGTLTPNSWECHMILSGHCCAFWIGKRQPPKSIVKHSLGGFYYHHFSIFPTFFLGGSRVFPRFCNNKMAQKRAWPKKGPGPPKGGWAASRPSIIPITPGSNERLHFDWMSMLRLHANARHLVKPAGFGGPT